MENLTFTYLGFKKLNKAEVLELMGMGAILRKTYGVYSHWSLDLPNGKTHYNLRKGVGNAIGDFCEVIDRNKEGYTLKLKK
jgi:hypothetical protein